MIARLRPPALRLPDQAAVRWTSFTKIIRQPEENWPAQILSRPLIAGRVANRTIALVADPTLAKTVLGGGEEKFPRWRIYQQVVGRGTGRQSLSAAIGLQWRRQRRAFSPMFRAEHAARVLPLARRVTTDAIAAWRARGDTIRVDGGREMTQLTLGIIWQLLFGAAETPDTPPFVARAAAEIDAAQLRGELDVTARKLAELADAAEHRAPLRSILPNNPFDDWNAASASAIPRGLSRQELYDNARVLLGAGYETTALTLTWALWLVAQDAETQRRIHREVDEVLRGGPVEDAHLGRLSFTRQVLNETLRLFPPAFVTVRQTREPIVLAGEHLPAATVLAVCIYALHRHLEWWQEPDVFWPDRFLSGEPRHRHAFLPFSAGPHACIGAAFATQEAVAIFATILQHFGIATDTTVPVRPRVAITLRPDREVPIILKRRT
jgi:cytochrome P450